MEKLKCPVCQNNLVKFNNTYKCEKNHSYDISSKGYTNMLLANHKHSINPGDSKEMILSRVRFLELDYYNILRKTILETIKKYAKWDNFSFCDLACGEGYYTNFIHQKLNETYKVDSVGIDISKYAIIEACKKQRALKLNKIEYVIGNLMNLPFIDESFDFMLNCFALLDEKEFNRVLKENGYFVRVLPDADHLLGIKQVLYKNVILNVMKEKNINGFELVDEIHIKDDITLKTSQEIHDLFTMTPYYYKTSKESIEKLLSLPSLTTRISFVLLVYKKVSD